MSLCAYGVPQTNTTARIADWLKQVKGCAVESAELHDPSATGHQINHRKRRRSEERDLYSVANSAMDESNLETPRKIARVGRGRGRNSRQDSSQIPLSPDLTAASFPLNNQATALFNEPSLPAASSSSASQKIESSPSNRSRPSSPSKRKAQLAISCPAIVFQRDVDWSCLKAAPLSASLFQSIGKAQQLPEYLQVRQCDDLCQCTALIMM